MNAAWFNERAVVLCVSAAQLMEKLGPNIELDQILFDSLRIYSCSYVEAKTSLVAALMEVDRPPGQENLDQVRKAMALIKANPKEVVSLLENFAKL